jgi:hypothetical protein
MLFNDRDLGVLGAGALLAVLCLVLPLPFVGKVVAGLSVLVGFIVLALLRLGPDRIPLEEWLIRRIRFRLQARRYTYQQPGYSQKQSRWSRRHRSHEDSGDPEPHPTPSVRTSAMPSVGSDLPVALAMEEVGVYPLVTVLLTVIGIYFLVWLAQGGAAEISLLIGGLLR